MIGGIPMPASRSGDSWRLLEPLIFESAIVGTVLVPAGFTTDFASVPRLPVAYLLAGDAADAAAVVHDYLYRTAVVERSSADDVFAEAMEYPERFHGTLKVELMRIKKEPAWRRGIMWAAVRAGGGGAYNGTSE